MIRREALGEQIMVSFDRSTGRIRMNSHIIKVIAVDHMVWFQGKQLALALGFKDPIKSVLTHVDDSDRQLLDCHAALRRRAQQMQHTNIQHVPASGLVTAAETRSHWVNECGFYSLVYGSTLPSAKAIRAWVIREGLPSTRRTGELLDTEHNLVEAYDGMPVVYIGDIGTHDGIALVKIGCSDTVREMVRKHKTEFGGFILQRVFSSSNNRQIKKLLKEQPCAQTTLVVCNNQGQEADRANGLEQLIQAKLH